MIDPEFLAGHQAALDAICGSLLPIGGRITWSLDPAVHEAAVARFETRAALSLDERMKS